MKVAALADIHGNLPALEAVLDHLESWKPDLVLVLGDLINRGPRSQEVLHLILERSKAPGWHLIRGNHEGYVLRYTEPDEPRSGLDFELRKVIYWTYQSLSAQDLETVRALPTELRLEAPPGQVIRAFHASTAGDRVGIYPDTSGAELERLVDMDCDLFLVGHTHQAFIINRAGTVIVNAGSVGLPFDGDRRAGYARLAWQGGKWQAEIIRLEYDRAAAREDYFQSGFIPEGGELADLVLAELDLGWPQLAQWFRRFEDPVRAGQLTIEEAVKRQLLDPNIEASNPNLHSGRV